MLLVFSLVFYAWGEPLWIVILLFNVFVGWLGGRYIERYSGRPAARVVLFVSVACQVLLLFLFKYLGFVLKTLASLTTISIPYQDPGLPIGISFFTFHLISYLVDVYRGEARALRSYDKLLLYISMFPQLVAGPIIRYADVQHQLSFRNVTMDGFSSGISRFVIGLGKKVVIANSLAEIAPLFLEGNLRDVSLLGAWFGILVFALQIYFDFSGYSDMAIGLGKMFGFTFKENFEYPYVSTSATEFWRRWNISVGRFFRDYVYIPLGGNRRRPWLNLFAVWFLTGLWHGASWNFVLWGLYFGVLIALEKAFLLRLFSRLPILAAHVYFGIIVLIGWVFFYFDSLSRGLMYLRTMFGMSGVPWTNAELFIHAQNHVYLLALAILGATPLPAKLHRLFSEQLKPRPARAVYMHALVPAISLALLALSALLLVGKTYVPFFYFRF